MVSSATIVVGASRGIGAELVHQIAENSDNQVYATVRKPTASFDKLSNVRTLTLDQTDSESIDAAAKQVEELDTLIMNGALGGDEHLLEISDERLHDYVATDIVGPLRVVKAFLPALSKRETKKIVFISSDAGSLSNAIGVSGPFRGPYAVMKAALNMIAIQLYNELHEKDFTVVAIHPGWVATDMGNKAGQGAQKPEDSVNGILKVVGDLKTGEKVKFVKFDGSSIPW